MTAARYPNPMTKLLDDAVTAIRRLPPETQDDLGRFLLAPAEDAPLHPGEIAALDEAEAEIARGERAPAESVRAFWRSHGL